MCSHGNSVYVCVSRVRLSCALLVCSVPCRYRGELAVLREAHTAALTSESAQLESMKGADVAAQHQHIRDSVDRERAAFRQQCADDIAAIKTQLEYVATRVQWSRTYCCVRSRLGRGYATPESPARALHGVAPSQGCH